MAAPHHRLTLRRTIIFEHENDIISYTLEKIISFPRWEQYLFVANCIWWIAGIIGLDQGLTIHIDNLVIRQGTAVRGVLKRRRNMEGDMFRTERSSSTKNGSINPLTKTKQHLMRQRRNDRLLQKSNLLTNRLSNFQKEIIHNHNSK